MLAVKLVLVLVVKRGIATIKSVDLDIDCRVSLSPCWHMPSLALAHSQGPKRAFQEGYI